MSNNQMVSVPRELVEFAVGFKRNGHKNLTDQRSDQDNAQDKLRVLLSQPAEQHQGELVGEVVAFGEGLHEIAWSAGRMPKLGAKLYTHAEPAEVERLRDENRRLHEAGEFLDGVNQGIEDKLRAQLAEAHALLRACIQLCYDRSKPMQDPLRAKIEAALSASAEPSAPPEQSEWHPLTAPGQIQEGDRLSFKVGSSFICARARQVINPGTQKEEIVYNRKMNHYFLTAMAVDGTSSHKDVAFAKATR